MTLGSDHVPSVLWDVELVLDHDCLGHVVHNLVRVNEFGLLLEIEDPWQDCMLETVLKVEITREVRLEELSQLLSDLI